MKGTMSPGALQSLDPLKHGMTPTSLCGQIYLELSHVAKVKIISAQVLVDSQFS